MQDLLEVWIPGLTLCALLAGVAWGAVGVSAASPGWGSIRSFLGTFGLGGLAGAFLPRRVLRAFLELIGVVGSDLQELPAAYRPGVDLIWAGLDQGLQLALLGLVMHISMWPRRAALRAAVALGAGSVSWRAAAALWRHGGEGLVPSALAQEFLGAAAAAFLLGSLWGIERRLAAWLAATLALALSLWTGQVLPVTLSLLAGLGLLLAADRLLWNWRVGESEGVERLYPLWRAAYEVHRQVRGGRRLLRCWPETGWRERIFRALGSWLPSLTLLGLCCGVLALPLLFATGEPGAARMVFALVALAITASGALGLSWAAAGEHAARFPQWAFLAGLGHEETLAGEDWSARRKAALAVLLAGLALLLVVVA